VTEDAPPVAEQAEGEQSSPSVAPELIQLVEQLKSKFSSAVRSESTDRGEVSIVVEPSGFIQVAKWLASDGGFSFLSDLCAVDWPTRDERFEVVYNLTNLEKRLRFRVKVPLTGDEPKMPSVTPIWPTANWHEREAFDMFGIVFEGHPDLRRILMPDEWEGHPLRKDYAMGKVPVEYKSLSPGF
jgi:NADH-quinone oxidoreductase subunit C